MTPRTLLAAAGAALSLAAAAPVMAQAPDDPLPAGPGKDAVMHVCTACHGAEQFAFARYSPEGWDREIGKMQAAGAEMTADEQVAILGYLSRYLSTAPAPQGGEATPSPAPGAF